MSHGASRFVATDDWLLLTLADDSFDDDCLCEAGCTHDIDFGRIDRALRRACRPECPVHLQSGVW